MKTPQRNTRFNPIHVSLKRKYDEPNHPDLDLSQAHSCGIATQEGLISAVSATTVLLPRWKRVYEPEMLPEDFDATARLDRVGRCLPERTLAAVVVEARS